MRAIRVGISGPGHDPARWFDGLDCVELPGAGRGGPTLAEAHARRADAPDGFEFILRAARSSPVFEDTSASRRSWKATAEVARALEASLVIFPTPSGFRPTESNATRMEAFFGWAHRDGIRLGWEPRNDGWPKDDLARLCRELSLTHVVDPLRRAPARGRPPCYRLNGVDGPGHRYGDDELSAIARRCDDNGDGHPMYDADGAYCIFGNASRWEDAGRLRRLVRVSPDRLP